MQAYILPAFRGAQSAKYCKPVPVSISRNGAKTQRFRLPAAALPLCAVAPLREFWGDNRQRKNVSSYCADLESVDHRHLPKTRLRACRTYEMEHA